jgi:hypothetical protein
MSLHRRTHPEPVEGCWACHIGDGPALGAAAVPSRRPQALATDQMEAGWVKDHAAYDRLWKQGYNPPRLDGCALRESRAQKQSDIEHPAPRRFEKAAR